MNNPPDAVTINIGCRLHTRFFRLDNGQIQWYDLDLPEPIKIRRKFFDETDRYKMIAKSVFDYSWIDDIIDDVKDRKSILIIAEGILMYFTEKEVKNLINKLATSFHGAEMLIETTSPALVKQSQKQDLIKNQYQIDAKLSWGIKRGGKWIEKLNNRIKFIAEWHYFDYHRDRWKTIRWMALIPPFKNRFGNRIVHLSFIPL
ncbi:MAG: class I SAM-dependent methyltransferase [Methanobacterium paludis]|nr:class I SAM-dependent methyltransferase [Methanobacterium paludis]